MAGSLSAIVLAGGASRRLGLDKAQLTFGGRPLLHIIIDRLSAVCDEMIVACGRRRDLDGPHVPGRIVYDAMPGQGPLAGIEAGLRAASSDFAFVVACDMPFLQPALLSYMADLPRDYEALVPVATGRRHPLHAIYARSCLPAIESLLARGENRADELHYHVRTRVVWEDDLRRHDPEGMSLFNLNEPADLSYARSRWEALERGAAGAATARR
jgi:molybdopterin-guanine dinucleotide biosynthesis protein A